MIEQHHSESTDSPSPIIPPVPPAAPLEPAETRFLKWLIFGSRGVRVGWSVALFLTLFFIASGILGAIFFVAMGPSIQTKLEQFSPKSALLSECLQFVPLLIAAAICALVEKRSILDYNLRGNHRLLHFITGLIGGISGALTARRRTPRRRMA